VERGLETRKMYLACCIDNLSREVLAFVSYHLTKSIFDGGIVALNEVAVNELDC